MQYDLTEEQLLLRDMVRKLAKEKVEPGAGARDQKGEFSWEMVKLIRENGLFGVDFPEEYGGSGAGLLSLIIVCEGQVRGAIREVVMSATAIVLRVLLVLFSLASALTFVAIWAAMVTASRGTKILERGPTSNPHPRCQRSQLAGNGSSASIICTHSEDIH